MNPCIRRAVQAMTGYVPGEQPRRRGLIKLNTNENPYPPSPRVRQALRRVDLDALRRYPDPVSIQLRRRIARIHRCGTDQVFVGNGSDEILALCTRAFVEDDGCVGFFDPSYSLYGVLAQIRGVGSSPVPLGDRFEWRTPPTNGRDRLFFLTCPNAPTGIQYPKDKVARFCRGYRGVVVIDEAYVDFARWHCMDLALNLPNVLVMRTFSKSYSLAGLRVGYAVGARPLVEALFKIKDSYNLDAAAQRLALAALSDRGHMRRNAARIRASRERLARALRDLEFTVYPSETNFLWVRPPRVSAARLFRGLRERRILTRYFPGPRTGDHLRITVGTDAEVAALIRAAADLTRRA